VKIFEINFNIDRKTHKNKNILIHIYTRRNRYTYIEAML
jgi:hypothetical protein